MKYVVSLLNGDNMAVEAENMTVKEGFITFYSDINKYSDSIIAVFSSCAIRYVRKKDKK